MTSVPPLALAIGVQHRSQQEARHSVEPYNADGRYSGGLPGLGFTRPRRWTPSGEVQGSIGQATTVP